MLKTHRKRLRWKKWRGTNLCKIVLRKGMYNFWTQFSIHVVLLAFQNLFFLVLVNIWYSISLHQACMPCRSAWWTEKQEHFTRHNTEHLAYFWKFWEKINVFNLLVTWYLYSIHHFQHLIPLTFFSVGSPSMIFSIPQKVTIFMKLYAIMRHLMTYRTKTKALTEKMKTLLESWYLSATFPVGLVVLT